VFNPLYAELNSICHLLALIGARPIFHISMIRFKYSRSGAVEGTDSAIGKRGGGGGGSAGWVGGGGGGGRRYKLPSPGGPDNVAYIYLSEHHYRFHCKYLTVSTSD